MSDKKMVVGVGLTLADQVGINSVFLGMEGVSIEQAQHMRDLREKLGLNELGDIKLSELRRVDAMTIYSVERGRLTWLEGALAEAFKSKKVNGLLSDVVLGAYEQVQRALRTEE
jgi:hypothetical protein